MNQGVNQLIFRLTGYDNPGVFTLRIRSTVTEETGCIAESVVCIVTDGIGSVGQATHQITNITGKITVSMYCMKRLFRLVPCC